MEEEGASAVLSLWQQALANLDQMLLQGQTGELSVSIVDGCHQTLQRLTGIQDGVRTQKSIWQEVIKAEV